MNDPLLVARLTVMLLRASVPQVDSLRAAYAVILAPDSQAIPLDSALRRISALQGLHTFTATVRDGYLVIHFATATPDDEVATTSRIELFDEMWRRLNVHRHSEAFVEARGFDESLVVPVSIVDDWLHFANCNTCSLGLSRPTGDSAANVIAVLYLGSERRRRE